MAVTATFVPNTELTNKDVNSWYWTADTSIKSIAVGDVNGDGQKKLSREEATMMAHVT